MEWLVNTLNVALPYIEKGLYFLIETGIGTFIGMTVVNKWSKKHSDKDLAETISTKVTNNIVNKDILVSLETMSKEQILDLKDQLIGLVNDKMAYIQDVANILNAMAKIMLKFKSASDDEKQELLDAINGLQKREGKAEATIKTVDTVKITLEPVKEAETTEDKLF